MLRHGFEALGLTEVVASTDAANVASVRVLEKAGMTWARQETFDGLDTVFFTAGRDRWLAARVPRRPLPAPSTRP